MHLLIDQPRLCRSVYMDQVATGLTSARSGEHKLHTYFDLRDRFLFFCLKKTTRSGKHTTLFKKLYIFPNGSMCLANKNRYAREKKKERKIFHSQCKQLRVRKSVTFRSCRIRGFDGFKESRPGVACSPPSTNPLNG